MFSKTFLQVRSKLICLFFQAIDSLNLMHHPASVFDLDGSAMVNQSIVSIILAAASLVGSSGCFPCCHDLSH